MNADPGATASPRLDRGRVVRWGLVALALALLILRLSEAFDALFGSPLNGDLPGFFKCARDMHFFYDSSDREPVQVLSLKIALWWFGETERAARVLTVVQTLIAAGVVYLVGSWRFSRVVGLLALFGFALNPIVSFYGVSGLRAPLFTALTLGFGAALFHPWSARRQLAGALVTGLLAAVLVLTRTHAWIIVLGGLFSWALGVQIWRAQRRSAQLRFAGLVLGIATLLYAPYPLLNGNRATTVHANFWSNIERSGEPGQFKTAPPLSTLDYVFQDRNLWDIGLRVARNLLLYATHYLPHYLRSMAWLAWLLPLGLLLAFWYRRGHMVALLLLALAQVVFILNLNPVAGARGVEARFVYTVYPLALYLLGLAGVWLLVQGGDLVTRRWPAVHSKWRALRSSLLPPERSAHAVR